jgi:4-hydroxy-3-methylbut-2-enyl diphosphate reductase IspH
VEKYDNSQCRFYWSNGSDRVEMTCESWSDVKEEIIKYSLNESDIITFGKYKGKTLEDVAKETMTGIELKDALKKFTDILCSSKMQNTVI